MLRKLVWGSSLLLATANSAWAITDIVPYVGLEVGVDRENAQIKDTSSIRNNTSATGAQGGAFAGLGVIFTRGMYVALEGFIDASSTKTPNETINTPNGPSVATLRALYNYGVSFIPGLMLTPKTMGYLKMGIINTRFLLHETVVPTDTGSNNGRNSVTGGQFGIGLQGTVLKDTSLRLEYDYNCYRTFTLIENRLSIHDNQLKLGILYTLE